MPLHDGILSRDGWYLLDDTISPLLVEGGRWYVPRPERTGAYQDGYLFAYGRDYAAGLRDFRALTGAAPLLPRRAFGNWFSQYSFFSARAYEKLLAASAPSACRSTCSSSTRTSRRRTRGTAGLDAVFFADPRRVPRTGRTRRASTSPSTCIRRSARRIPRFARAERIAGGLPVRHRTAAGRSESTRPRPATSGTGRGASRSSPTSRLHEPFEPRASTSGGSTGTATRADAERAGAHPRRLDQLALCAAHTRDRGSRWLRARADRLLDVELRRRDARRLGRAPQRDPLHRRRVRPGRCWTSRSASTAAEGAGIGLPYVSHDIGSFHGDELPVGHVRALGPVRRLPADPAAALRPRRAAAVGVRQARGADRHASSCACAASLDSLHLHARPPGLRQRPADRAGDVPAAGPAPTPRTASTASTCSATRCSSPRSQARATRPRSGSGFRRASGSTSSPGNGHRGPAGEDDRGPAGADAGLRPRRGDRAAPARRQSLEAAAKRLPGARCLRRRERLLHPLRGLGRRPRLPQRALRAHAACLAPGCGLGVDRDRQARAAATRDRERRRYELRITGDRASRAA